MNKCVFKRAVSLGVVAALLAMPLHAEHTTNGGPAPSGEAMAADLLFARPLGLVATIGGTVMFIVSLPFSILGGNVDDAGKNLVLKPAKSTFIRPLGEFDDLPAAP